MGDKEQTFKWLEQAYKEKTEPLLYLRVDPRLDSLRSDPRFEDLLRRVNLESGFVAPLTRVVDTRPRAAYIKGRLPTAHHSQHIAH